VQSPVLYRWEAAGFRDCAFIIFFCCGPFLHCDENVKLPGFSPDLRFFVGSLCSRRRLFFFHSVFLQKPSSVFLPAAFHIRQRLSRRSRSVQSRTVRHLFFRGEASNVLAATWRCRVRIVTPSFLAASRVEQPSSFTLRPVSFCPGRRQIAGHFRVANCVAR
jgi:hypothetical protein